MAFIGSMKSSLHSPVTVFRGLDSFLSSLRANLQISYEDLNASHLEAFHYPPENYDLRISPYSNESTLSSGFGDDLEDPPSPTDTSTTSTTHSFPAPTTWTYHASTEDDRRAALKLIAESIREQRSLAIRSILLHPAVLTVTFLLFTVLIRCVLHAPQKRAPVACCIGAGILIIALLAAERATRKYVTLASTVGDSTWLREGLYQQQQQPPQQQQQRNNHNNGTAGGSKHHHSHSHSHHNSMPLEDEILVTKDHDEVVGALVLRTARTNALSSGAPSANGMRALRHRHSNSSTSGRLTGVIRAWTVKSTHRQRGLGLSLLESAVSICRVRRLDGPIFADEQLHSAHIPGLRTLCWPFNAGFEKVEEQAKDCLKGVIEGKERWRK
ncbi:conserved hypothetical protein [Talaromyces stipitatus ATCC 10500]|uniref:Uncharacterized protein n=1 Tax=Talaromyces stipitatus (strain ATCC 10500 / CBS 375.48 / QM 6759 / NRRL 1006) TaxID=441959 RepID=B8LY37_TALSN|nr:uncharacterized protein TSTA_067230 [Talaromyces stipitatus ATCC 10500]EED23282.1 conserved hypothetical protein [Talaromyces stipitatus ATCC 10500]